MRLNIIFLLFIFLKTSSLAAQDIKADARWLLNKKEVEIGQPIQLAVWIKHDPTLEILFPDSAHRQVFSPFDWIDKAYFPTRTENGLSTDSIVYTLSTFELDSVQSLELPIFILKGKDTTIVRTPKMDLVIKQLTKDLTISDSTKTIANTEYWAVKQNINYLYLGIGSLVLVLLGIIFYIAFGERIRRSYRLRRLRLQFLRFVSDYEKLSKNTNDTKISEHALHVWKSYLENLQKIPFTSYTSKEIAALINNEELNQSLKSIDLAIYGSIIDDNTRTAWQQLKAFAVEAYENKIQEVRGE